MWDLPRPGIEPVSLALAGGLLTSEPPRKPRQCVYWVFYHKWLKFQCPTQTCWIHACTDGVWGSLCVYQAPPVMCPALQWSFGETQKSNPYFIMRKWIPVSHSPALNRTRGLPYQEGQPCMAWVQGIWTSKHKANLDQPIGQKHLKPLAGTMGARQAMPAPLLPSLSQAERKKKKPTQVFWGSCSHCEFRSARTQAWSQDRTVSPKHQLVVWALSCPFWKLLDMFQHQGNTSKLSPWLGWERVETS